MELFTHQRKVEIYGHRGYRAFAPENTIPGFELAIKAGVDWLDMDVVITGDNVFVANHDLWLNPDLIMLDSKYIKPEDSCLVNSLTYVQLQKYSVGLNPKSAYSKFFPDQKFICNTKIPSLQQVIDYADSMTNSTIKYQIEVKNNPLYPEFSRPAKELAKLLYQELSVKDIVHRVEVQAFDWNILLELQKIDPIIKTAYLVGKSELIKMLNDDVVLANSYHAGYFLRDFDYRLPKMIKEMGGSCYDPEDIILTKTDIDLAHALGLKVVVWRYPESSGSIFDPILTKKLFLWGIDGIIIDNPGKLCN